MRLPVRVLLALQLLFFLIPAVADETVILRASQQRVVFETEFGNLVFSLYPEIAPRHVAQFNWLVETGAYDSTHFFRVIPGFVLQLSDIYDRKTVLTAEQQAANQALPAEFSPRHMKHRAGTLSMARQPDDPDSATSSFSILLDKAPHLDGEYTIFGEVESGNSVIKKMLAVPRNGEAPSSRLSVNRAYIIKDRAAYYEKFSLDPVDKSGAIVASEEIIAAMQQSADERNRLVAIMMSAIIFVGLVGFFLYGRLSKPRLLSLLLVNVLMAMFLLYITLTPQGHRQEWLAVLIFIALFVMFRIMSQFESNRD